MNTYPYRTYAEVDLNKLQHNLKQVRKSVGSECKILFVLKADAYGHGTAMCARYSEELVDWYGVATLAEALSIRQTGVIKPILLFGQLLDHELSAAADHNITINACSLEYACHVNDVLSSLGRVVDCHIEIDSGMNRTGLMARSNQYECAVEEAKKIFALSNIHVTGIYTHFSCGESEELDDVLFTKQQYDTFCAVVTTLRARGTTSDCAIVSVPAHISVIRIGKWI